MFTKPAYVLFNNNIIKPRTMKLLVIFLLFIYNSVPAQPKIKKEKGIPVLMPAKKHVPSIVGIWRIIEYVAIDSAGNKINPFGEHPVGYFIYAPSRHLSINIMRTPPIQPLDFSTASIEQLRTRLEAGFSYFGHYTVQNDSTVIHHVEGGTVASYIGTDQLRRYKIIGDTLRIGSPVNPCCRLIRAR